MNNRKVCKRWIETLGYADEIKKREEEEQENWRRFIFRTMYFLILQSYARGNFENVSPKSTS